MLDDVVVDVEIQKAIGEPGIYGKPLTWDDTDQLGISVAVVYEHRSDTYLVFGAGEEKELQERLKRADRVSSFNGWKFDYPVTWGLAGRQRVTDMAPKTNDLLVRIWASVGAPPGTFGDAHKGWGLDVVARATLGYGKSGHGAHAPSLFRQGKWTALVSYCLNDVKIERDLAAFVDRYGYVVGGRGQQVKMLRQDQVNLLKW